MTLVLEHVDAGRPFLHAIPSENAVATFFSDFRSLPGGSLMVLQREDGRVDRYVFDGTFRDLATGARITSAIELGTYGELEIIRPDADPDYQPRLSAFHAHLLNAGVTELELAPDALVHAADLAAEKRFPWPKHRFA